MAEQETPGQVGTGQATPAPPPRKRRGLLFGVVGVVVGLVAGAAAFVVLGGEGKAEDCPEHECVPEAGSVLRLEPVVINLADGRYLQVGIALQLADGVDVEEMAESSGEGAQALDAAVDLFATRDAGSLLAPDGRATAKQELEAAVVEAYGLEEVIGLYLTGFVID